MAHHYSIRYQFNVDLYNADVVINILVKALTATPLPDFNLCVALLSEQHSTSNQNQDEPDHLPQMLPILMDLSRYLNECRFPTFWALYNDDQPQLAYLRENFTVEVVGFEDAIRDVVVRAVKQTFTKIGRSRLESYLSLTGETPPGETHGT